MFRFKLLVALLSGCGVFLVVVPSEADTIFRDSFNYPNGDFNGLSISGQEPWLVQQPIPIFTTIVSPGLEYPGYPSSGGAAKLLGGTEFAAQVPNPALDTIRNEAGVYYAAALLKGEVDWSANYWSFWVGHRIPVGDDLFNTLTGEPVPYSALIIENILFGTDELIAPCSIGLPELGWIPAAPQEGPSKVYHRVDGVTFCDSGVRTGSGPDGTEENGTDLVVLEITSFTGDTIEEKLDEVRWAVNPDLGAGPTALQEEFDATGVWKADDSDPNTVRLLFDPNAPQLWNVAAWEYCQDCEFFDGLFGSTTAAILLGHRATSRTYWEGDEVFGEESVDGWFDEIRYTTTMDELFGWHVWNINSGGDWDTATNWRNELVPNGDANNTNVIAIFDDTITEPQMINTTGAVTVKQIQFHNENTYTVAGTGAINLVGSTGELVPTATVHASQGTHVFSVPVNTQTLTDVMVGPGATLNFDGPLGLLGNTATKLGEGTMNVNDPANTGSGRLVVAEGTLGGNGTVGGDVEVTGGRVGPGTSPGILTVGGTYSQGSGGTLEIEVAGTTPGSGHDQLAIDQAATLDGTLEVIGLSSLPAIKDHTLTILAAAGGVSGTFANTPDLVPASDGGGVGHVGAGLFFQGVQVNPNDVTIDVFQALEGDTDGDSDIDITDFNALATNFDATGMNSATNDWVTADFDGNGTVDITDFNFIAVNFAATGYASASGQNIPEPSSFLLVALGLMVMGWYRCSKNGEAN